MLRASQFYHSELPKTKKSIPINQTHFNRNICSTFFTLLILSQAYNVIFLKLDRKFIFPKFYNKEKESFRLKNKRHKEGEEEDLRNWWRMINRYYFTRLITQQVSKHILNLSPTLPQYLIDYNEVNFGLQQFQHSSQNRF